MDTTTVRVPLTCGHAADVDPEVELGPCLECGVEATVDPDFIGQY